MTVAAPKYGFVVASPDTDVRRWDIEDVMAPCGYESPRQTISRLYIDEMERRLVREVYADLRNQEISQALSEFVRELDAAGILRQVQGVYVFEDSGQVRVWTVLKELGDEVEDRLVGVQLGVEDRHPGVFDFLYLPESVAGDAQLAGNNRIWPR